MMSEKSGLHKGCFSLLRRLCSRRALLVFFAFLCVSCGGGGGGGKPGIGSFFYSGNQPDTRVASLAEVSPPAVGSSSYTFLLISDLHFGVQSDDAYPKAEITKSLVSEVAAGRAPRFIAVCGDQTENGTPGEFTRYKAFEAWLCSECATTSGLTNIPVYGIVGNHDLYNGAWDEWKSKAGPGTSFYRISISGRSFYFIDTASGTLGGKQLRALETAVKNDSARKFFFSHYPLALETMAYFKLADARECTVLLSLICNNKVDIVFTGHRHEPLFVQNGALTQLISGSLKPDKNGNAHWSFVTVDESAKKIEIRRYTNVGSAPARTETKTF